MQIKLNVDGMTCSHCENALKKTVSNIAGVSKVLVDLSSKTVTVSHNDTVKGAI
jgi:copper chaperone